MNQRRDGLRRPNIITFDFRDRSCSFLTLLCLAGKAGYGTFFMLEDECEADSLPFLGLDFLMEARVVLQISLEIQVKQRQSGLVKW